jgi:hypothetical protein
LVCSAVSEERPCNSCATCILHDFTWIHPAEYPFTPGTWNLSRMGEFAKARILACRLLPLQVHPFCSKFLVPGINGYSAGCIHAKLCVWYAHCTAVTDSFCANCRTHQLLCCGVAIYKTSGI